MVVAFLHDTTSTNLVKILESGKLKSIEAQGQTLKYKSNASKYVFMTPADGKGISVPRFGYSGAILHFNPESLLKAYPRFFINNGNMFGPLDGEMEGKTCGCHWTYNTMTQLDGACVKHSLKDILDVLQYDFDDCDGGPEIGFENEVDLLPHLMYITMSPKDFETIKSKIPPDYLPYIKVKSGGKRKTQRKPRKMSKSYCKKTSCKKMGFTQKASCRPWKNCY